MSNTHDKNILKGMAAGLLGGLAGALVMTGFQALVTAASEPKSNSKKKEEDPATVKAAKQISEGVFDHQLTKAEKEPAGEVVHYAMGAVSGAIFGAAAEIIPHAASGFGMPFGTAVWIVADEIAVPAAGLSKEPTQIPASTHAYALASHLVYGFTTDMVRRAIRSAF